GGGRRYSRSTPMSGSDHPISSAALMSARMRSAESRGITAPHVLVQQDVVPIEARNRRHRDPHAAPLGKPALRRSAGSSLPDTIAVMIGGNDHQRRYR